MTTADAVRLARALARVRPVRNSAWYSQWTKDRTALIAALTPHIPTFDATKFISVTEMDNPQDAPTHFRRTRDELTPTLSRDAVREAIENRKNPGLANSPDANS